MNDVILKDSYILHVDGDSFFASCEVSIRPFLRGLPVVVGKERSIATAMSYEAKKLGIHRGMLVRDIRKICPHAIILASDYRLYSIFSARMFSILRRYSDIVEHYSIDECFADIKEAVEEDMKKTGYSASEACDAVGQKIKEDLEKELGMTFSVGIGPSKVLAKIGSKKNKPSGFCIVDALGSSEFLKDMQVGSVWGIGPGMSIQLGKKGIKTVHDLLEKDRRWIERECDKHVRELWHELHGVSVLKVTSHASADQSSNGFSHAGQAGAAAAAEADQKSIQRTRTFFPASSDRFILWSEISSNIEEACSRARQAGLVARSVSFYLKTQEFTYHRRQCELRDPSNLPQEILTAMAPLFAELYDSRRVCRATGITLHGLRPAHALQESLFSAEEGKSDKLKEILAAADRLTRKFGSGILRLASSKKEPMGKKMLYLPEIMLK